VKNVNIHIFSLFFHINLAVTKNRGWWRKLLAYFNSALKVLLGTDIFLRWTKKFKLFFSQWNMLIYTFFHISPGCHKKNCGWWRKTTYIFEFSVKSTIRIRYFSSWDIKKVKFCWPVLLITLEVDCNTSKPWILPCAVDVTYTWLLPRNSPDLILVRMLCTWSHFSNNITLVICNI
jgi:hypothetical protein